MLVSNHLPLIEYNPKGTSQIFKDVRLSPRFNDKTNAIRWHFFLDTKFLDQLQSQSIEAKQEIFTDLVYDTNDFALLKAGYWLLLRIHDDKPNVWRLRQVKNDGDGLTWTEIRGDANILKKLHEIAVATLVSHTVLIHFFDYILISIIRSPTSVQI